MSMRERLDPDLVAPLDKWYELTNGGIDLDDVPKARRTMDALAEAQAANVPSIDTVKSTDHHVPGRPGDPDVFVRVYEPVDRPDELPALLWIHGGGYVLGSVERDDLVGRSLCRNVGCVVASVDYRLAPEHPYPAPVEDCYSALKWLHGEAQMLGVDRDRIAIAGASAGGGLTAGLALLARDRKEVNVIYQMPIYPMIDDRNITPASDKLPDTYVWSRKNNRAGWNAYLGDLAGQDDIPPYAAAARAEDLSGLPPTYIPVGDLDLFLEENIRYAERLMAAGVPTELHVYPGGFHGFNGFVPGAPVSRRFNADRDAALRRALHGVDEGSGTR